MKEMHIMVHGNGTPHLSNCKFCYMMVIINLKLTMEILVVAFVHSLVKGSL